MRIRKQAAKLLGWSSGSSFPASSSLQLSAFDQYGWPPEPPCVQSAESYSGELQCRLNLSPWDAIESPQCTDSQDAKLESVNEDQMSAFENSSEAKEKEKEKIEEEEEQDNKVQRRKRGEKETEAMDSIAVINCKKTDGKGWHCKRPAQSPHSLCTYHLTQLRSYRARFEDHVSSDYRKKSAATVDCGGAASSYYYYYSILGPWWGKRRGPVNGSSDWNEDCGGKSTDNETHAVACDNGEEEAEEEEAVEEQEEEEEEEDGESRGDVIYKKKKKKRVIKRRGRKPVKARSLKSIL
ncbi:uncharacterized protein LOC110032053 [Phalaenopsis equestris]|uniref:uncharacterized protein LOC110032053 n=1 Tax=Phalaenopsis equestris TaxID=78828 RepID=UPI0009E5F303|nr:uncharacterized protein LOC110032053 [Phalaenopsis equestris]